MLNFIFYIQSKIIKKKLINLSKYITFINFKNKNFKSFTTNNILLFQHLFESYISPNLFYYPNSFHLLKISFSYYYFFNKVPLKVILEDPNRTNLQLKYSIPLIKNSQLLSLHDYLYFI